MDFFGKRVINQRFSAKGLLLNVTKYIELFKHNLATQDMKAIHGALKTERPIGSEAFTKKTLFLSCSYKKAFRDNKFDPLSVRSLFNSLQVTNTHNKFMNLDISSTGLTL